MKKPLGLLLKRLRGSLPSFAMITTDGLLLTSWSRDPVEAGLLPQAMENVQRYFPLSSRDLVLVQDPFIGGPGRDGLALVSAWSEGGGNAFFLATTVHCPSIRRLRLPPAPLRLGGEVNSAVLEALGDAREAVLRAETQLLTAMDILARPAAQTLLSKKSLQEVCDCEHSAIESAFAEIPDGNADVELKLPTGETLRARLHSEAHALAFDFSGTSAPKSLCLPLAATTGAVWSAVRERLGLDASLDSFGARHMPVTVPNGCFLNAKNGACDRGLDEAAQWLTWAVEMLFQKWDRRKLRGLVNPFDLKASLKFTDGRGFDLRLPSGSPAREDIEGVTFWRQREGCAAASIEEWEREWPLRLVRVDERMSAAAKSRVSGGRGLHLQIEFKSGAELSWGPPGIEGRIKTEKHQGIFDGAQVLLKRGDAETALAPVENHTLRSGDVVTFLSGSGGGLI